MPRARNIKPGFFTNEDLPEIEPMGRLLFIGLWTLADREGRLEDRPKKIKGSIFPYDNCDIDSLLNDLQEWGFIKRYEAEGMKCIQVVNFLKHQNPHPKEAKSVIPAEDGHVDSGITPHQVTKEQRKRIMERDGNKCVNCGSTKNLSIDHIIPRSKGGSNEDKNLQTLCNICNSSKGNSLQVKSRVITRKETEKKLANRADILIPDTLNPDTLNPDTLNPEPLENNTTTTGNSRARARSVEGNEPDLEWGDVVSAYSDNIRPISGAIEKDRLHDLYAEYGKVWVIAAITEAVECSKGPPSMKYITAILDRWKREGFRSDGRMKRKPVAEKESPQLAMARRAIELIQGGAETG